MKKLFIAAAIILTSAVTALSFAKKTDVINNKKAAVIRTNLHSGIQPEVVAQAD